MKTNKTLAQKLCLLDLVSLLSYTAALLAALCFLVLLPGCSLGEKVDREPVQTLECTRPASLSGLYPAGGMSLLAFDNDKMGYSALCGSGDTFWFADASLFLDAGGALYAVGDAEELIGVGTGRTTLYNVGESITACDLTANGIAGEMYDCCVLPEAGLLVGGMYENGAFRLYVIDPAQLTFEPVASAVPVPSPLTVDETLLQAYWGALNGLPVAESLQEARQQADVLEQRYGVRILLSSQCREAAELSSYPITLSDTMDTEAELNGVRAVLAAMDRSFALYPEGFQLPVAKRAGERYNLRRTYCGTARKEKPMGNVTADRAWDVHPVTEADMEAYLDIYLNSYPAYKTLDEECRAHYRSKHLTELREDTQTRTMGLFEGGTLIATMKLILFSMNFFGVMQPACGVMALEVHPLHKKKGAALYMIRYAERYARENGALLTMLLPFNIGFYRRMGYGFGGKLYEYHLPTGALPRLDGEVRAHLRLLQPEEFDQAMDCQRRFAARNHGMVEKFDEELRGARGDIQVRRMGYYDGGRLLGYAAYRFESASACNYTQNRLSVEELVYESGTVLQALLGGLRMQEDLAQTVILRTGEEDFHHLLDDPQDVSGNYIDYGFLQTNVSAVGTMFKLTDGADFVRRTGYRNFPAGTLTAAFRYRDEMADREEELRIGFADGRWAVAEGTADVTVICRQGDLAALLMGSCGLAALLRLGAASADDAEKARQLAQLLYCSQKPWLNADY